MIRILPLLLININTNTFIFESAASFDRYFKLNFSTAVKIILYFRLKLKRQLNEDF